VFASSAVVLVCHKCQSLEVDRELAERTRVLFGL